MDRRGSAAEDRADWSGSERMGAVWTGTDWQERRGLARRGAVWMGRERSVTEWQQRKGMPEMPIYKAGQGVLTKKDAQLFGETIEALDDIRPGAIVDAARSKRSKIHHLFEWDDGIAGEAYRRSQA